MEMRAPIAVAIQMDAPDPAEAEDRPLDPSRDATEVGRQVIRQVDEESTCCRVASHTVPGRLQSIGGWRVQFSSDQTVGLLSPAQMPHGSPPGSPFRGGSGITRSPGSRGTSGS